MTVVKEELKEALEMLKNTGVRITPQRHAILEYLVESMTHPTADKYDGVFPGSSCQFSPGRAPGPTSGLLCFI